MTDQTEALKIILHKVMPSIAPWVSESLSADLVIEGVFVATEAARKAHEELWEARGSSPLLVDMWAAIDAVLAAGPLPPRECVADGMTDEQLGAEVIAILKDNHFGESGYANLGADLRAALFQPSPASGEQSPPAGQSARQDEGALAGASAAGESPAPTPPAPAATRVAVSCAIAIGTAGDILRMVVDTHGDVWEMQIEGWVCLPALPTLHADLPGDAG